MLSIGIVGSRRRTDRESVVALVNALPEGTVVVSGGCRGVDSWAEQAARSRGLSVRIFKPDFTGFASLSYYDKCERYYARNREIVKASDFVFAFVSIGGKGGTENTLSICRELGIPFFIIDDYVASVESAIRMVESAIKMGMPEKVFNSFYKLCINKKLGDTIYLSESPAERGDSV